MHAWYTGCVVAPGDVLQHRYEVLRPLGRGSAASAFLAKDRLRNELATIKLLRFHDAARVEAFHREFTTLAGRFHPHLVHVRDLASFGAGGDRQLFYAADYVPGDPLSRWAASHDPQRALTPIAHVLSALHFLHQLGIRHGDVKPDNIVVDPEGHGVLIDLGCAQPIHADADTISGTPSFMAPELLRGQPGDARSDLFSVGITLRLLAGDTVSRHNALLAQLTHEDPDRRPSDAADVLEALGFERPHLGPPRGRHADLLARDDQRRILSTSLAALLERSPGTRCLAITGADGSGRTRLLQEMKWEAQRSVDVIEGWARNEDAVTDMLARALDLPQLRDDVSGVLEARTRVDPARQPFVLVLDDTHLLPPRQTELLHAWLRLLEPADPCLLLLAGRDAPPQTPAASSLPVGPLDRAAITTWCGGLIGPRAVRDVLRLTSGMPADVEALMARIASGSVRESDLRGAGPELLAPSRPRFANLPREAYLALGWLAIKPIHEQALLHACGCDIAVLLALQAEGWVTRDHATWQLARAGDAPVILSTLAPSRVANMHRSLATEPGVMSDADRAFHLAMAGDLPGANGVLLSANASIEATPQSWRRVASVLEASSVSSPATWLTCARIHRLCGDMDRATSLLARVLRARPDAATRIACRIEAALCYIAAGKLRRAEANVRRGLSADPTPEHRAALLDVHCRLRIQEGTYRAVVSDGIAALALAPSPALRARLEESVGVALSYLGRGVEARHHLKLADQAMPSSASPRDQVRLSSYQAIVAYRDGDLPAAIAGYRKANHIAEEHGLADHMASTAMNLGTAYQQQGAWGPALEAYQRGSQIARAIGKENTRRTLLLNVANLMASIGALDRARDTLAELRHIAHDANLGYVGASILALDAELALASGEFAAARDLLDRARESFRGQGALREICEMDLHCAELAIAEDRLADAAVLLDGPAPTAPDLRARWNMRRAAWLLAKGDAKQALAASEEALAHARDSKQPAMEAEAASLLADLYQHESATQLARDHQRATLRIWETIGVTLPDSLRAPFWRHPLRARLRSARPDPHAARSPNTRRDLVRILDINRRLNSSLAADEVLAFALDAAIELSEAERGFLIVRPENGSKKLEVAVARNLDRERIGHSHLKFSRSIAEKVVRTGEPVSTTDALADARFRSNASVHAMRLRSVVCVPVKAPEGMLGAIYLDHRFRQDQFDGDVLELLQAFADQVAIALRNARLHADLERRTRALQAEQARVQELLAGQAREIEKLAEEVRSKQEALEFRYDYSSIVGSSKPMHALFLLLDRATDADIDVLIQGESGTGKELVARALHFNGPRRSERFVSINCAALPDALLESELFGVTRGAFTGADRDREGLIAAARGGTLLLDEVGEMSLPMQAKLLRVLQERKVRPLGANRELDVDLRLVCATNRRLREEVERGRFREDLYYRIGVIEMTLPSLRERREDIPELCAYLLARAAQAMNRAPLALRSDALRALMRHPLPGNVRQLDNVLRRALVMADGEAISVGDLELSPAPRSSRTAQPAKHRAAFEELESKRILAALEDHRWNVSAVARALGIPRNTLYRKLHKYRLDKPPG